MSSPFATFDNRVWANKQAREVLNRAASCIDRQEPEYVDDPDDPSLDEVLEYIQREDSEQRYVDAGVFSRLMSAGLTYRQMVYWYLFYYGGFEVEEILCFERGINELENDKSRYAADLRNIEGQLTLVCQKIDVDVDPEWDFFDRKLPD